MRWRCERTSGLAALQYLVDCRRSPMLTICLPNGAKEIGMSLKLASASGIPTTVTARRIGDDMPNGKPYSGDEEPEISPGRRADLLLVDGDLTRNISATRSIRGVWIDGTKVAGAR